MTIPAYTHLVGRPVIAQNPVIETARWEGTAVAYVDSPSIVLEQTDGFRLVLPADWFTLNAHPDTDDHLHPTVTVNDEPLPLTCAICLHLRPDPEDAVTVIGGTAVCDAHYFAPSQDLQFQIALAAAREQEPGETEELPGDGRNVIWDARLTDPGRYVTVTNEEND